MTTKRNNRMIFKMSWKGCFDTATSISRAFYEQTGKLISWKSVSRRLNKEKLVARIPCRKPLISKKNQKVRLDFATEHILWTEEQWNMVHFSDESKFNLFGSYAKRFMGKSYLLNALRKLKFRGRSVMAWGMISSAGVGPMVGFHSNVNASVYKELLR